MREELRRRCVPFRGRTPVVGRTRRLFGIGVGRAHAERPVFPHYRSLCASRGNHELCRDRMHRPRGAAPFGTLGPEKCRDQTIGPNPMAAQPARAQRESAPFMRRTSHAAAVIDLQRSCGADGQPSDRGEGGARPMRLWRSRPAPESPPRSAQSNQRSTPDRRVRRSPSPFT